MNLVPNPIFLNLGFIEIRWYAVCIVAGILAAFFMVMKRLEKMGLDPEIAYDYVIVGLPFSTLLARMYYVVLRWDYYGANPSEILKIYHGGLAIHGGLIGVMLTIFFVSRYKKVDPLKILDASSPCILLAQAIGRWGNYFNMEAYGSQTSLPWAISVVDESLGTIKVHPTFLYESVWCILGVFIMIFWFERKVKQYDGELICFYMIYYSLGRFFIEQLRTDSLMLAGLKMAQLVSISLIIIGLTGIYIIRKRNGEKT